MKAAICSRVRLALGQYSVFAGGLQPLDTPVVFIQLVSTTNTLSSATSSQRLVAAMAMAGIATSASAIPNINRPRVRVM